MGRICLVPIVALLLPAALLRGDEPRGPDGSLLSNTTGLYFGRVGDQKFLSIGGGFFPRQVKVTTSTPEGPVVTRFTMPRVWFQEHPAPPFPILYPAHLCVEVPDVYGNIYLDGVLLRGRGISRQLESPPLPQGQEFPVRLRAVFQVGDQLLIEEKIVLLQAAREQKIVFDGSTAVAIPLKVEAEAPAFKAPMPAVKSELPR